MANISINMDSLKPKRDWKRHKVLEGTSIYRILPPFGKDHNGYPYKRYNVIWGLTDPTTNKMRPFASSITTEQRCPVYEYLDLLKKKVKEEEGVLAAQGLTEDQIKEKLVSVTKFIGNIRPKAVFAYNGIDKSGVVGILEIKSTAHKKLISLMHEYVKDYNQDPTSLNAEQTDSGIWFKFSRTGKGLATEYDVEKSQTKKNTEHGLVFVDDREALPENVIQGYDDLAYDLGSIYKQPTYDELKALFLYNLQFHVKENAFLLIPGFDDFSSVADGVAQSAPAEQAPVADANVPQGTGAKINLGSPEEADETPNVAPVVAAETDDDILAMAENIMNEV